MSTSVADWEWVYFCEFIGVEEIQIKKSNQSVADFAGADYYLKKEKS